MARIPSSINVTLKPHHNHLLPNAPNHHKSVIAWFPALWRPIPWINRICIYWNRRGGTRRGCLLLCDGDDVVDELLKHSWPPIRLPPIPWTTQARGGKGRRERGNESGGRKKEKEDWEEKERRSRAVGTPILAFSLFVTIFLGTQIKRWGITWSTCIDQRRTNDLWATGIQCCVGYGLALANKTYLKSLLLYKDPMRTSMMLHRASACLRPATP